MKLSEFRAQQAPDCVTCDGEVVKEPRAETPQEAVDYVQDLEMDLDTARFLLSDLVDEMESVLKKDERLRTRDGVGYLGVNQRKDITQSIVTAQEFLDQWVEFEFADKDKDGQEIFYA